MTSFPRPRPVEGRVLLAAAAFDREGFFVIGLAALLPLADSDVARRVPADGASVIVLVGLHGISSEVRAGTQQGLKINGRYRERGGTLDRVCEPCQERLIYSSIP